MKYIDMIFPIILKIDTDIGISSLLLMWKQPIRAN